MYLDLTFFPAKSNKVATKSGCAAAACTFGPQFFTTVSSNTNA
jgi:hypothetical protein